VFHAVDRVVESGHDPRRFLTDLLERLRDLILVQTVPDAVESGLVVAPDDQAVRLREQASSLGRSDLVRLAQVADDGIVAMRGTTPTRLQLELVCSRLLLPGVADDLSDLQARLDRMERTLGRGAGRVVGVRAAPDTAAAPTVPDGSGHSPGSSGESLPDDHPAPASESPAPTVADDTGLAAVRRGWPEVLERLRELRKTPWTFIKDNTEPIAVTADVITLGVRSPRLRDMFADRDDYSGYLQQALLDTLGRRWRVEAVVHPGAAAAAPTSAAPVVTAERQPRRRHTSSPDAAAPAPQPAEPSSDVAPDDAVVDDVSGADLLSRELGASVIEVVDDA
jgi:DNA polymerase-3 subunit gamma/tau